jgi:hypothetical protein
MCYAWSPLPCSVPSGLNSALCSVACALCPVAMRPVRRARRRVNSALRHVSRDLRPFPCSLHIVFSALHCPVPGSVKCHSLPSVLYCAVPRALPSEMCPAYSPVPSLVPSGLNGAPFPVNFHVPFACAKCPVLSGLRHVSRCPAPSVQGPAPCEQCPATRSQGSALSFFHSAVRSALHFPVLYVTHSPALSSVIPCPVLSSPLGPRTLP